MVSCDVSVRKCETIVCKSFYPLQSPLFFVPRAYYPSTYTALQCFFPQMQYYGPTASTLVTIGSGLTDVPRTSKSNDPRGHSTSPPSQAPSPFLQQIQGRNWPQPGQEYHLRGSNLGSTWCRISGTAPAQASDHTCFYPGVS